MRSYLRKETKTMNEQRKYHKLYWLAILLPVLALACRAVVPSSNTVPSSNPRTVDRPVAVETVVVVPPNQIILPESVTDEQSLLIALYQQVNPAVVNVTVYSSQNNMVLAAGQGSGFVFDGQGHIVTNAHVVHGAEQVDVAFADGTVRAGEVVGEDLNSDLAVVKVENMPPGTPALPLGQIEDVIVGQTVIAIGNPFGLEGTLTRGIVSAVGRTIPALTQFSIPQAIQTDAAINPGNSGGPLLNLSGEVIGVNAQIETSGDSRANSGVGFAVPVSIVARVVPAIIENGEYVWPWLGVRGGNLTPSFAQANNLEVDRGAYLSEIVPGGPAEKAGLRGSTGEGDVDGRPVEVGGDVIIAIDGQPVRSFDDLLLYVALQTTPGQEVVLTILRDGGQQEVTLELEPRPKEGIRTQPPFDFEIPITPTP